ncbi:MAG: glycosyltransferase [Planctomycetes bacterium]|nr:glycosyltransferase [Planctomycetota bacterium]
MQRPNVAVILDGVARDGDTRWLQDTLRYMDRDRYRIHVVSLSTPDNDVAIDVQKMAVPVHSLDLPEEGVRWTVAGTFTLFNLFRQMRPRLVHTVGERADVTARIAARFTGVPRVVTTLRGPRRTPGVRSLLTRTTAHMTDVVIVPTRTLATEAVDRWGVHPHRVRVVPPGIDLGRLTGEQPAEDVTGEGPLVVACARMDDDKGIDTLVDAAAILLRYRPGLRVVVAGTGVTGISYIRRAQRLGIDDRVLIPGARADVPALLAAADVFVHPARRDGLPLALLEAMAVGVPCVATLLPSITEHLQDDVHALLCAADQPALLADRIDQLLGDPELARRIAGGGRALVQERFSPAASSAAVQDLWDLLLTT